MQTGNFSYKEGEVELEAYVAYPQQKTGKLPAMLIAHAWEGRNDFACEKARYLAELGYIGFALDMYGKGVRGKNPEENTRLMTPFMEDRGLARRRMISAFTALKNLERVDVRRMGVMGFCFGGLCALDLARSGAELRAAISFHGLLRAPEGLKSEKIHAKVLALHGHDDSMVPPEEVRAFQDEMTRAKVDWQMHIFGNTVHGFTNPAATNAEGGVVYNELSAKRSWQIFENFLTEVF